MSNYGLSAGILASTPLEEALDAIAEAGFSAVELKACQGTVGSWGTPPPLMSRALARRDLAAWSVHSPPSGWNLAAADEQARKAAVQDVSESFSLARDLGANLVVCHCNAPIKPFAPDDYSAGLARTRMSLEVLAEQAGREGVRLAVETMISRPEKRPATRVSEVLDLIEGLGEHVGVCLDTGHSNASGANVPEEAILAGQRLFNVHLQDNHGRPDEDEHLIPGHGTIDWQAVLAALDRIGFTSPRIIETKLLDGPDGPGRTIRELQELLRCWQTWEQ
jgi:sugar phosphate isomerase/epimerase